ncbi:hypothetical protein AMJ39_08155 [candidate division TA06 bacterium DG_24]|uniref:Uncharacterized protein n=1 Tax=candidate division TA06 bacterium DG_24 TaxID=1703770 RepID=A0A0S7WQ77_UNCT6|nr:MAG: hypothetical protein AMJ39_08155 [candidate division TA06 bacterium DG_24]
MTPPPQQTPPLSHNRHRELNSEVRRLLEQNYPPLDPFRGRCQVQKVTPPRFSPMPITFTTQVRPRRASATEPSAVSP